ncbi:hypothetical protein EVU96_25275 [Bacillus infantis]|uniref:hypothetical protein n=1 Tax=Bacillus infantis TaxID=324767 RepID=UPI00101B5D01|nr:hypothetical protein [Bacillus infantis]RYI24972.1 hypothetical protein EVU96_25275 [Bacillus infantis]
MKFTIKKKFMLAKIDEKEKVNLYTLLDTDTFEKFTSIGTKVLKNIEERTIVEAEVTIRTSPENFILKSGETKWVETCNTFITELKAVKDNA